MKTFCNWIIPAAFLSLIAVFVISPSTHAEQKSAPVLMNYQGVLNDSGGSPLPGNVNMTFRLFTQETGGSYEWQETHSAANAVTVDSAGVFKVILNSTGSASGNLANLLRDESVLWLEIEVQGETLVPRQRLTSTAYALSAPWSGLTGIPSDFSDGTDNIAQPGTGLTASGGSLNMETSYQLPQSASNGQVAKWNSATSQWVPGEDLTDSGYSAGSGLTLTGSVFAIDFAGTGSATTVSRSDHNHLGASWNGFVDTGLSVTTTSSTTGATAIKGSATGNTLSTGIQGETSSTNNGSTGVTGMATGASGQVYGVYGETQSSSSDACGVYGIASGGGYSATGVYGETNASEGSGVYGKNNSSTGYGVYSDGHGKINGDLTVTADIIVGGDIINSPVKTGYVSVTAPAFRPEKYDVEYENDGLYYLRLNGEPSLDDEKEIVANVDLPHGVTVTKVTLKGWTDSEIGPDPAVHLDFRLYRTAFDGSSSTVCSFTDNNYPASGTSAFITYESTSISNATVDNSSYGYLIIIASHIGFKTHGVIIEYTY